MLLSKQELLMCLYARGHENVMGFDEAYPEMTEQNRDRFYSRLMGCKLMEQDPRNPEGYRFSAFGQVLLDTVGKADIRLEAENRAAGIRRWLFLQDRDAFYVCVEEMGENVRVDLLPSLPIFIGGYASLLKDLPAQEGAEAEESQWQPEQLLVSVRGCGAGEEYTQEIDRQGIARETGPEGVSYQRRDRQSGTNAITMWMLNALRRKREEETV